MGSPDTHLGIARPKHLVAVPFKRTYEFGPYRLEVLTRRLLKNSEPVSLTPKAFDLLLALVERRHRVVDKSELIQTLWPDSFVEEANLTQTIFMLRKVLGEGPNGVQYVQTLRRHGYRFVGDVREVSDETGTAPAAPTEPPATLIDEGVSPERRRFSARWATVVAASLVAASALTYLGYQRFRTRWPE